ncbi:MAG: hypothetical protein K5Q00_00180 [Gammaproteobacteria bacterium]|nr:hypothetical protein [Gammaproteobacteria bacterium]
MHRIDNESAVTPMPAAPATQSHPNYFFDDGNEGTLTLPTRVDYHFLNTVQEEIIAVLVAAGITPSKTDRDQLLEAIYNLASGGTTTITSPLSADLALRRIFSTGSDIELNPGASFLAQLGQNLYLNYLYRTGQVTNKIQFSASQASLDPTGSAAVTVNASGMQIVTGARVTSISNDNTLAADSATLLPTQGAGKTYIDNTLDVPYKLYITGYTDRPIAASNNDNIAKGSSADSSMYILAQHFAEWEITNLVVYSSVDPVTSYDFDLQFNSVSKLTCSMASGQFSASSAGPATVVNPFGYFLNIITAGGAATTGRISYSFTMTKV